MLNVHLIGLRCDLLVNNHIKQSKSQNHHELKTVQYEAVLLYLQLFLINKKTTMGKGDKKTKKGKIVTGSYGNSRKKDDNKKKSNKKSVKKED